MHRCTPRPATGHLVLPRAPGPSWPWTARPRPWVRRGATRRRRCTGPRWRSARPCGHGEVEVEDDVEGLGADPVHRRPASPQPHRPERVRSARAVRGRPQRERSGRGAQAGRPVAVARGRGPPPRSRRRLALLGEGRPGATAQVPEVRPDALPLPVADPPRRRPVVCWSSSATSPARWAYNRPMTGNGGARRRAARRWLWIVAGLAAAGAVAAVVGIWHLPERMYPGSGDGAVQARAALQGGLLTAAAALTAVAGALIALDETRQANTEIKRANEAADTRERAANANTHVRELYSTAISHLDDPSLDVRLGGIYALERGPRSIREKSGGYGVCRLRARGSSGSGGRTLGGRSGARGRGAGGAASVPGDRPGGAVPVLHVDPRGPGVPRSRPGSGLGSSGPAGACGCLVCVAVVGVRAGRRGVGAAGGGAAAGRAVGRRPGRDRLVRAAG